MQKRVAILLSIFKGEEYLDELLESINNQKFKNFVVIFREDSISKSESIALLFSRLKIPFEECKHRLGRLGSSESFMHLLEHVGNEDYVSFCDQDDIWYPNKLSRLVEVLSKNDNPTLYCSNVVVSNTNKLKFTSPIQPSPANAIFENIAQGCTIGIHPKIASDMKTFPRPASVSYDHWAYFLASKMGVIHYDSEPSLTYRIHIGNEVGLPSLRSKINLSSLKLYQSRTQELISMTIDKFEGNNPKLTDQLKLIQNGSLPIRLRTSLKFCSRQKILDKVIVVILITLGIFKPN